MRIRDLYDNPHPAISFEFFPPKNDEAIETLFRDTVPGLKTLNPAYISVTQAPAHARHHHAHRPRIAINTAFNHPFLPPEPDARQLLDDVLKRGFETSSFYGTRPRMKRRSTRRPADSPTRPN